METPIISVDQMRKSDAYTIEHFVSGRELMYRAAMGVYESYDGWQNKKVAIVCGGGNNGGDGYALAGILKKKGMNPVVYKVSEKMSPDGEYYHDIAVESGIDIEVFGENTSLEKYHVIVDCILGTGFTGEVRGMARKAIDQINKSEAYVISVDINSGMNGDTGEASTAVKSNLTVSIGYLKTGLVSENAKNYIERLTNADIGIVLVNE